MQSSVFDKTLPGSTRAKSNELFSSISGYGTQGNPPLREQVRIPEEEQLASNKIGTMGPILDSSFRNYTVTVNALLVVHVFSAPLIL